MSKRIDTKQHKIMSMDAEKRQRIVNAAMREFSKGFKKASTDESVREAGVSKGLLFHYFGTKEGLYNFVIWYAFDVIMDEYISLINVEQADLLDRLWQVALLKRDLSYQYPAIFEFLTAAYLHAKEDPGDEFATHLKIVQETTVDTFYRNIDFSLFKEEIDPMRASNVLRWVITGLSEEIVSAGKPLQEFQENYDSYLAETRAYFDLLRSAFYR